MTTKTLPIDAILNSLIAKIEAGTMPFQARWEKLGGSFTALPLRVCGKPYQGINTLILWAEAMERGYSAPTWLTFKAALDAGGCVRKGETGTKVCLWKPLDPRTKEVDGVEMIDANSPAGMWRVYTVFNVEQCDNLPEKLTQAGQKATASTAASADALQGPQRPAFPALDAAWKATGANITETGDRAFYRPSTDQVFMPLRSLFADETFWHATLAHELAHWTGHESRCARTFAKLGDRAGYAMEELVAEMAAAMIGQTIGLPAHHMDDHATYLGIYLEVLKANPRALLGVASKAQAAANHVLALVQPALASAPRDADAPANDIQPQAAPLALIATPSAPPVVVQIEAARHARTMKRAPQLADCGPLFEPIQPGLFG